MNLTGRPVYQKGTKRRSRAKARPANKREREYWDRVAALGCAIAYLGVRCRGRITIHHCGTGAGGRKNHKKVIGLCQEHHQGKEGIDGKAISKREWQEKYATERSLLDRVAALLRRS